MSNTTMMTPDEIAKAEEFDPTVARTITVELPLSEKALRQVRSGFNPDKITDVGKMHMLGAAMITFLEEHYVPVPPRPPVDAEPHQLQVYQREVQLTNDQNRMVSMAITDIENGTMHGVKAITTRTYADKNVRR